MTIWGFNEYELWLNSNCPENDKVDEICMRDVVKKTLITPDIGRLHNLKDLVIRNNFITCIPPEIGQLQNLTGLYLGNNQITSLPPEFGLLKNLKRLCLSKNKLTCLPPEFGLLENLELLWLRSNQLTTLPPEFGQLQNLSVVWLEDNKLTTLPPEIGQLQNLFGLWLFDNKLTTLPAEMGQLLNLNDLELAGNPIHFIPMNVRRLLERRERKDVYNDPQSVHNSNIQKSIKESIMRLLNERIVEKDVLPLILSDTQLTPFAKESLIEYANDESVHSVLNLTFSDILAVVWNRLLISPHSKEIKSVLNTEMKDSECKCFTGRISRLINCLNGFDPLVQIQISDNEQIGNVISLIKTQLEDRNEYTVERHKEEAKKRLSELNVKDKEIEVWLSHIE